MGFRWDQATEDRLVSLWAGGTPLADIPKALGAVGPDAATEHIQIMRAGGRWPEEADRRRKVALAIRGPSGRHGQSGHGQNARGDGEGESDDPFGGGGPFVCRICGHRVSSARGLGGHMGRHRTLVGAPDAQRPEPARQVPVVGEAVDRPPLQALPGGRKRLACPRCHQEFGTEEELQSHLGPPQTGEEAVTLRIAVPAPLDEMSFALTDQPLRAIAAIAKALGSLDAEGRYSVRVAAVRAEGGP